MRRCISIAMIVLLSASALPADPRSDAAAAKCRLEEAEARLRHCDQQYSYTSVWLSDTVGLRNGALAAYDTVARKANDASASIAATNERIDALAATSRNAAARAAELRSAFEQAKVRADAASAEVEKYRAPLIAAFETSPEFVAATIKVRVDGEAHDAEVEAAMQWLCDVEPYAELYESSGETSPAIEQLKTEFLMNDPWVKPARERFEASSKARDALVEQFNKKLESDEQLTQLIAAATGAAEEAKRLADEANAADAERVAAENEIAQLQSYVMADQQRITQLQSELDSLRANVDLYVFQASNASFEVWHWNDECHGARREYEHAARDLRRTIELADAQYARGLIRGEAHAHGGFAAERDTVRRAENDLHERGQREGRDGGQRLSDQQRIARVEQNVRAAQARPASFAAPGGRAPDDRDQREARESAAREIQIQRQREQNASPERSTREQNAQRSTRERDARAAADHEAIEARLREQREAEARRQSEAESHSRAEQARSEREARTQRDRSAQAERESRERAERDAQARAQRDAQNRERRESESRAQREAKNRAQPEAESRQGESEARQRESASRVQEQRESEARQRESQQRERESARRESEQRESQQRQSARRESEQRESQQRESARRESEQRESQQRESNARESARREVERQSESGSSKSKK